MEFSIVVPVYNERDNLEPLVAELEQEGLPVIMNLEGTEREVARRLIDFASGLCYGLDGSMEKVANGVYLLKPAASRGVRYDDYDD